MSLLATVAPQINMQTVVKITKYGDVLFKQQDVTEFHVAENESVMDIH